MCKAAVHSIHESSLCHYRFQETASVSSSAPRWLEGHTAPVLQASPSEPTDAPAKVKAAQIRWWSEQKLLGFLFFFENLPSWQKWRIDFEFHPGFLFKPEEVWFQPRKPSWQDRLPLICLFHSSAPPDLQKRYSSNPPVGEVFILFPILSLYRRDYPNSPCIITTNLPNYIP